MRWVLGAAALPARIVVLVLLLLLLLLLVLLAEGETRYLPYATTARGGRAYECTTSQGSLAGWLVGWGWFKTVIDIRVVDFS
jgi:hypothetical protein